MTCVIFHPRIEVLISCSEDKSIRIWDLSRRVCLQNVRRETDRFWILAVHPTLNYFAAGFDTGVFICINSKGMAVYKLERERIAHQKIGHLVFGVSKRNLCVWELTSDKKTTLCPLNSPG